MTDHATVFGVCENKCFVEVSPKSDTDAVEARVEALETEIGDTDIKTRLDAIDGEVDALQANDTAQNASISALQTQVAELAKSTGNRVMYCVIKFSTMDVPISGAISGDTSLIDDGYETCCYYYYGANVNTGNDLTNWCRSIRDGCVIDYRYIYNRNNISSDDYTYSVMGAQITDAEFDAIFNSYNDYVAFSGTFKIDYTMFGVSHYYQYNTNHMIVAKGTLTIEDGKIVSKTLEKINNKVYAKNSTFNFFVMLDYSTVTRV